MRYLTFVQQSVHQVGAYESGSVPILQSAPSSKSMDIFDLSWLRSSTLSVTINGQHIDNLSLKNDTRELLDLPNFPTRSTLVYEVHFIAGRRILWFGSYFKVMNKSAAPLSLAFRRGTNAAEYSLDIPSQGISSIPFHLLNDVTTTFYLQQRISQDTYHTSPMELNKVLNKVLSEPHAQIDMAATGAASPRIYSLSGLSAERLVCLFII